MAGQTFFGGSLPSGMQHVGRRWSGPDDIEGYTCDCPKTACGLTEWGKWAEGCEFHGPMKSIRQSHSAEKCPGA